MKLLIIANCITGSLRASIERLNSQIICESITVFQAKEKSSFLKEKFFECDYALILSSFHKPSYMRNYDSKIILIPNIIFPAFHPDMNYFSFGGTEFNFGNLFKYPYASNIAMIGFRKNFSIDKTKELFNYENFLKMGYFSFWENCVETLLEEFLKAGFDEREFYDWFGLLKRQSPFMYTFNHPKEFVIVELAQLILRKIGAEFNKNIDVRLPVNLDAQIWPLYPEIANHYFLKGNYFWRIDSTEYIGIECYLNFIFSEMHKANLQDKKIFSYFSDFNELIERIE